MIQLLRTVADYIERQFRPAAPPPRGIDIEAHLRSARAPRDLTPERLASLHRHSTKFKEAQESIAKADRHTDEVAAIARGGLLAEWEKTRHDPTSPLMLPGDHLAPSENAHA